MADAATLDYPLAIFPGNIDHMGHVNNAVYLTWVQDAVVKHWERFAPAEALDKYLWVALKHDITYRRAAFIDDNLVATVVLERVAGARAFYNTLIKRGEEVLAEVQSIWCSIDSATHRPIRIARDVIRDFLGD